MAQSLPPAPIRTPIVDGRGIVTAPWLQWLRGLYERIGGPIAPSNNDISGELPEDAGIEELKAVVYAMADAAGQSPAASEFVADDAFCLQPPAQIYQADPDIETRLAEMAATLAALQAQINDLRQGLTP